MLSVSVGANAIIVSIFIPTISQMTSFLLLISEEEQSKVELFLYRM